MQNFSNAIAGFTLGLALALTGCAGKESSADAAWMQRMESVVSRITPAIKVSIQAAASQTKAGDTTSVRVTANTAGFLYVLHLDGDGRMLRLVFPMRQTMPTSWAPVISTCRAATGACQPVALGVLRT